MDISRIEFFCEDKNVGRLLRSLAGIAVQEPKVQPVVNAKASANGLAPATNGELLSLFAAHLRKKKVKQVLVGDLKAFVQSVGRPESAYTTLRHDAQRLGVLKKVGHGRMVKYVIGAGIDKINLNGGSR